MYIETRYYDSGKAQARMAHVSETISNDYYDQYCDDVGEGTCEDITFWVCNNLINVNDISELTSQLSAGYTVDITNYC